MSPAFADRLHREITHHSHKTKLSTPHSSVVRMWLTDSFLGHYFQCEQALNLNWSLASLPEVIHPYCPVAVMDSFLFIYPLIDKITGNTCLTSVTLRDLLRNNLPRVREDQCLRGWIREEILVLQP